MPAVEVRNLVVRYGSTVAVDDVSFTADHGAITAMLGPNGAGKTSTVEAVEGYRRPVAGTIRVLGIDPYADHPALVARMGVMLQRGGLYPTMSSRDALALFASFYDNPLPPDALLERLALTDVARTPYRRLSGGEQQRLALALALVGRPEVAFLDEPTAGVDPRGRQVIRQLLAELRDEGVAVVVTTHDLEETDRLADRLLIIDGGRIVAAGTPDEVRRASAIAEIRFSSAPGIDTTALAGLLGAPAVEQPPGEYAVAVEPTPQAVAALTGWLADHDHPVGDVRAAKQSLEDVFLRLTSEPSER